MNTTELQCILERVAEDAGFRFLGVFAADRAPTRLSSSSNKYPCAYVVNTDCASQPGRHWVACFASSPHGTVEFFDSYGQPPSAYPNIRFPLSTRSVRSYSRVSFQSNQSFVCGHYCIYYICKRIRGWTPKYITYTLSRFACASAAGNRFPQDRLVRRFVRNMCRVLPKRTCCTRAHTCNGGQCCTSRCRQ